MSESVEKVRLDKWLWAARFFKTRSLAKEAIEGGKVHYNGQRCKPGKVVELEAELQIRQGWFEKTVLVKGLCAQRKNASFAQTLYEETADSQLKREKAMAERKASLAAQPVPFRRPNKKDRRLIHRFKSSRQQSEE
ncbi:MAG: ribosome-associated heat shock protein Hsp15 [Oleiphilaceae bacterium]|nr:ribosome-associated heat shock protein Hsp15 [Oleiphilaceae bacterium]